MVIQRSRLLRLHLAASSVALVLVASFLVATVAVELLGSESAIATVKGWIVRALLALVPALALAGLSGRRLAGASRGRFVRRKLRRMRIVAATGLLVLVPCAIALDRLASAGQFDLVFFAVQSVELLAGASNLTLLALNFRDGMAVRARRRA